MDTCLGVKCERTYKISPYQSTSPPSPAPPEGLGRYECRVSLAGGSGPRRLLGTPGHEDREQAPGALVLQPRARLPCTTGSRGPHNVYAPNFHDPERGLSPGHMGSDPPEPSGRKEHRGPCAPPGIRTPDS
ncbi:putative cuticle collagen 99 [Panthera leo]|uniref:putative cuticle collagen 99 n=1 Tax=Panthera leo TaxID=9689 RepID=UPI001C6A071F|nr:putative cuticle collagen 99 [Panthera leo]